MHGGNGMRPYHTTFSWMRMLSIGLPRLHAQLVRLSSQDSKPSFCSWADNKLIGSALAQVLDIAIRSN